MRYKKSLNINKRIDLINKNYYMIGILATNEDNYPFIGSERDVVAKNYSNNDIVFYVKSITTEPSLFFELNLDVDLFVGFAEHSLSNFKNKIINDRYRFVDIDERKKIIKDKLKNKILFLKLKIQEDYNKDNKYLKNFYIEDMEEFKGINNFESIDDLYNEEFIPVPGVNLEKEEFEQKLLNGRNILFPEFNILEYELDKIIVNNTLYYDPKNNWEITGSNKCRNNKAQNIEKIKIPDDFNKNILYKRNDKLLYISNTYNMYLDKMKSKKIEIKKLEKINNEEKSELKVKNKSVKNKNNKKLKSESSRENNFINDSKESDFLKQLYQNALSEKLYYKKEDLYNFHISVKTSPLTVISGMSGTGKTRMAQLYAETLSLDYNEDYLIIPISPSYTEPGDVLGYLNTMTGIYTPAETGLVDLLIKAEKHPDKIYMIIFDEMNLSQVEHWFSPFISLLELKGEARKLTLFNKKSTCHNNYKPEIKIGNNVIFVGTVNIDETTKDFSDRLLDRSNVITPEKMNFTNIKDELEKTNNLDNNSVQKKSFNNINYFEDWREEPKNPIKFLNRNELTLLDELHETLNNIDSQKGISFRIIENIARYIKNIPLDSKGKKYIEHGKAFDLQVKQRILTKLKGHQQQYGELIGELNPNDVDKKIEDSKIFDILNSDKAQEISEFNHSLNELKRKAKEMYHNGYAT